MFKIIELPDDVLDGITGGVKHNQPVVQSVVITLVGTTLTVNGTSQTINPHGLTSITVVNGVVTIV